MAVSDSYRDYVLDQLGTVQPIRHRRMFGGIGIYADDLFFALIGDDTLYFKTDPTNVADYTERDMPQFGNMGYHAVPEEVLEDTSTLQDWMEKAVAVAARSKNSGKKRT